ncbi:uncharacterized protein [Procambarus clarkii]|uniref:uncharacterized protein n=1 Tax=Procambarus clarkii TaxID=6728 RepID=UPI00374210A0
MCRGEHPPRPQQLLVVLATVPGTWYLGEVDGSENNTPQVSRKAELGRTTRPPKDLDHALCTAHSTRGHQLHYPHLDWEVKMKQVHTSALCTEKQMWVTSRCKQKLEYISHGDCWRCTLRLSYKHSRFL